MTDSLTSAVAQLRRQRVATALVRSFSWYRALGPERRHVVPQRIGMVCGMNCPICAKKTDVLILTAHGQRCRECKPLSEQQCYDKLISRIDALIAQSRVLCSEAFVTRDMETHEIMVRQIEKLELQRGSVRKPSPPSPLRGKQS